MIRDILELKAVVGQSTRTANSQIILQLTSDLHQRVAAPFKTLCSSLLKCLENNLVNASSGKYSSDSTMITGVILQFASYYNETPAESQKERFCKDCVLQEPPTQLIHPAQYKSANNSLCLKRGFQILKIKAASLHCTHACSINNCLNRLQRVQLRPI